jgi:hypothetical protein
LSSCSVNASRAITECAYAPPARISAADPDRLHDLLLARAATLRKSSVPADTVRALRHVSDGNRDQLLGLLRQRAVGEDLPAERLEGFVGLRRCLSAPPGELAR